MKKTAFLLSSLLLSANSLLAGLTVYPRYFVHEEFGWESYVVLANGNPSTLLSKEGEQAVCTVDAAGWPDGTRLANWGYADNTRAYDAYESYEWEYESDKPPYFTNNNESAIWTYQKTQTGIMNVAAKFEYITYDLDFKSKDGGSVPDDLQDVIYTNELALGVGKLAATRTGYHVKSWTATTDFDELFTNANIKATNTVTGADFGLAKCHKDDATVTLTVNWEPNGYEISADLAGGAWSDGSYVPPSGVAYDEVFSLPVPVKTGYVFDGWRVISGLDSETGRWGTADSPSSTLTDETLCKNDDKSVGFKNLNPTQDAQVTIAAQWSPAKITVHLNNDGAESGATQVEVDYNAAYTDLNVPKRTGSLFQGYRIDDVYYWDSKGQPTKDVWDIPTNCTALAIWNTQSYTLTYHENNGTGSKTHQELFNYNEALTIKDAEELGFSRPGCTFLGWAKTNDAKTPNYRAKEQVTFGANETLYAVWEQNYYISYDGNGATAGTMEVQKFVFGAAGQSLNPNAYSCVGYGFAGWATNRTDGVFYPDKYVIPQGKDIAQSLGETNTLYAVWNACTYYLAFDPNGGTVKSGKEPMGVQEFRYDTAQNLLENTYELNELWRFGGWSNTWNGAVYADKALVTNAYDVADGTNTLVAVWESTLTDLSRAMGCTNLLWFPVGTPPDVWTPVFESGVGYQQSGHCARRTSRDSQREEMHAGIATNGVLRLRWKSEAGGKLSVRTITMDEKIYEWDTSSGEEWQLVVYEVGNLRAHEIIIVNDADVQVEIDAMTWIPGGKKEPQQGDPVEVSAAGVSGDAFTLTIPTTSGADEYGVWTNADLAVPVSDWGLMEKKEAKGAPLDFVLPISGMPKLFFSAHEVK